LAFYDIALADGKILNAFSAMLRAIGKDLYRNIYILWGLHFTSLVRPATKSDDNLIGGLAANYSIWMKKFMTTKDEEIKRNTFPIIRFLTSEIRRRITPERLKQMLTAEGVPDEGELERSQAFSEPEINELIVRKEMDPPQVEGPSTRSSARGPD
jgi:hypothetical protein